MFSQSAKRIFQYTYCRMMTKCRNTTLASSETEVGFDPARIFFDKETQQLLRKLTRVDYAKVCKMRREGQVLSSPEFKFMTTEEFQAEKEKVEQNLEARLQMPPVVKVAEDTTKVISAEPALQGRIPCKLVCTDITFGDKYASRMIVVREPNGVLRTANQEERFRMNQVYFPVAERQMETPELFEDKYLMDVIKRKEYVYLLDRICLQFEPDSPEFHRLSHTVYIHVNEARDFDLLRSTRHFGPMAFYLAQIKQIDHLLIDIIQSEMIEEAAALIRLFHKIHPTTPSATEKCSSDDDLALVKHYATLDSPNNSEVLKILNIYEEFQQEKKRIGENIKKAHGINEEPTSV